MTIKSKISLALAFIFAIVLLLGGLSAFYLRQLADDARAILKDNYISLEYINTMQKSLVARNTDPDALSRFEQTLRKQEANVTEIGEQAATDALRREFGRLRRMPADSATLQRMQSAIFQLDDINRQAMFRKNRVAEQTAKDALLWLAAAGTLGFLVLFSFIINFPGYIAGPLRDLTRGIKQIASRNFEERLHFTSNDEFGELARSFNSMAQKLDEYEHSSLAGVLFEKKRIDTIVQEMSEGILGLDENRTILFANPVICRLLGTAERDLAGRSAPDVALRNDLLRTLIRDIMPGGNGPSAATNQSAPIPALTESGLHLLKIFDEGRESYFNQRTHAVTVARTGETEPIPAGWVVVLENITAYQERDLAKTNFIATVSHELKTPISAIKMSLKLLNDSRIGVLNEEQQTLVKHVRDDADRLLNITGELLNMAQVESGQMQLRREAVPPADVVTYATNALRAAADQKNLRLDVLLPADLPPVMADPDKASWVLVNFLSNAIRHSPADNHIDISVAPIENGLKFTVRDYGAGIRPEHRDRVFDRYFRAPGANGQASGTGLGLAISREFITAMNGQIGLDAGITDGASFFFVLPMG